MTSPSRAVQQRSLAVLLAIALLSLEELMQVDVTWASIELRWGR